MDIDKPLDELVKQDRGKGRGQRRGWSGPRKNPPPEEVAQMSGGDHRRGRRGQGQGSDKAGVVSVVFGKGTPEKVMTGRLTDRMVGGKPTNLVQAAIERGTQSFLKNHSKGAARPSKTRERGGKRPSTGGSNRKRTVIQHPLLRKLRIVRPNDPGYKRELRQLRNRTYAVRVTRNSPRSSRSSGSAAATASPAASGPMSSRFSSLNRK